ncbi:ImuA family protein [Sphingomonas sp.]|uniref:ImuA family protein n=1 Tax=Sphingomonas sp. TaxID=28214 RepID=UPI003D6D9DFE
MAESLSPLTALRQRIAAMAGVQAVESANLASLGHAGIDARLEGGLARGQLHEVIAGEADDASSAAGFASMLARRVVPPEAGSNATIIWLREGEAQRGGGGLYAPGLVDLGVDPTRLVIGVLPDALSLLRVAAEVVRCPDVGMAVVELWKNPRALDLTATRRLAVAAESSGVTALLLRVAAEEAPSAAHTRWRVRSVAALPLEADAPGHTALDVELVRQRGGRAGGRWILEWDRDQAIFRDQTGAGQRSAARGPALSGAVVSAVSGEPPRPHRRAG